MLTGWSLMRVEAERGRCHEVQSGWWGRSKSFSWCYQHFTTCRAKAKKNRAEGWECVFSLTSTYLYKLYCMCSCRQAAVTGERDDSVSFKCCAVITCKKRKSQRRAECWAASCSCSLIKIFIHVFKELQETQGRIEAFHWLFVFYMSISVGRVDLKARDQRRRRTRQTVFQRTHTQLENSGYKWKHIKTSKAEEHSLYGVNINSISLQMEMSNTCLVLDVETNKAKVCVLCVFKGQRSHWPLMVWTVSPVPLSLVNECSECDWQHNNTLWRVKTKVEPQTKREHQSYKKLKNKNNCLLRKCFHIEF